MGNPENAIFGICKVCGADGGDDPAASGADTPATDVTGNGVPLVYYEGDLMCELCKKQKQAEVESLENAERHADEERFRQQAGFTNTIT